MCQVFQDRGYKIVSGGTDNHLFLLDLTDKEYSGKQAASLLSKANITVNKNSVPGDKRSPKKTSGVRFGTPAMTRRGFKVAQAQELANIICNLLDALDGDKEARKEVVKAEKQKVLELCRRFPVYA